MDFSIRKGTIFEESRMSLQKWFMCIYLLNSNKKGISTADEAVNFAYWVIQHAIDVSSGGISGNITIAQIKNNENTQFVDISSAKEYIQNMYDYIHQFGKTEKEIQDIEIAPTL